jgi:hypothetical protein
MFLEQRENVGCRPIADTTILLHKQKAHPPQIDRGMGCVALFLTTGQSPPLTREEDQLVKVQLGCD